MLLDLDYKLIKHILINDIEYISDCYKPEGSEYLKLEEKNSKYYKNSSN